MKEPGCAGVCVCVWFDKSEQEEDCLANSQREKGGGVELRGFCAHQNKPTINKQTKPRTLRGVRAWGDVPGARNKSRVGALGLRRSV